MKKGNKHLLAAGMAIASLGVISLPTQAATVTYGLVKKSTLTNVNDAEGRWQFDGGDVMLNGSKVGHYVRKKRVSFGVPSSVNRSTMEMTIIWATGDYNFTVQGSHYFGTGLQVGGVSATSPGFTAFENAKFSGSSSSITLTY